MIKKRNLHRLFAALTILSLAIPVLAYSGCFDCGPDDYGSVTVEVFEDGHGEIRGGSTGNPCQGNYLEPWQLIGFEIQGAHLTFHSDEARRNYEDHKWEWYADDLARRVGWTEQEKRLWIQDRLDIERRQREARGETGRGGGDEQQSPPAERQGYIGLLPFDIPPDELPSDTVELGPSGGGKQVGGVRGGGGGGKP